jgi:hypothetical protein
MAIPFGDIWGRQSMSRHLWSTNQSWRFVFFVRNMVLKYASPQCFMQKHSNRIRHIEDRDLTSVKVRGEFTLKTVSLTFLPFGNLYVPINVCSTDDLVPVIVQFAGDQPDVMLEAARFVEGNPRVAAVDINCGCPQVLLLTNVYTSVRVHFALITLTSNIVDQRSR